MDTPDCLHRFLFEHAPIRGGIVRLDRVWQSILQRHDYPPVLRRLMGELCAAAVLLAATLKFKGTMVLQLHGHAALRLLVVECSGDLELRATAKWSGDITQGSLRELAGQGRFVITLDSGDGGQIWQGIVPLEGDSIAEMLQGYMERSEQIETRLWLAAGEAGVGGMLLQKLPECGETADTDIWRRATHLGDTVQPHELLTLSAGEILHRLYHEEDVRLFEAQTVAFRCTCSRDNVAQMLRMIGHEEVNSILAERGHIEVHCEFCNACYVFDRMDAEAVFAGIRVTSAGGMLH